MVLVMVMLLSVGAMAIEITSLATFPDIVSRASRQDPTDILGSKSKSLYERARRIESLL
jgi:hypothetical protein